MWQWLDRAPQGHNEGDMSWFHRHDSYNNGLPARWFAHIRRVPLEESLALSGRERQPGGQSVSVRFCG
jgi:hypothetical protein